MLLALQKHTLETKQSTTMVRPARDQRIAPKFKVPFWLQILSLFGSDRSSFQIEKDGPVVASPTRKS